MPYIALNNAQSSLAATLSDVATDLTVQTGHGSRFIVGTDYSFLTLEDSSGNIEVVKITARSTDSLTIERAQDGTTARNWSIGDIVECRPCKAAMQAMQNEAVQVSTTAATSKTTPVDADLLSLVDSAASNTLKKLTWANLKATLKTYFDTLYQAAGSYLTAASIGSTVQGYDADTAKTDVAQNWTASQRSGFITDNDLSFDLSGAGNNYDCTPSAGGTLTFTNIASNGGKSGYIKLVNGSNYAIAAHANTKIATADLTKISATGTYILSYVCDATNVFVTTSGNLA